MMKKILIIAGSLLVFALAIAAIYIYPTYKWVNTVETVNYDPRLTLYSGGGNSVVLTSEDNSQALIVDTKMMSGARKLREKVTAPEIIIVNTHAHFDHAGGNGLYPNAKIIAGDYTQAQWALESQKAKYPDELVKPGQEKILQFGDEIVHIRNMGQAHTTSDVVVYLEKRKMLITGDLALNGLAPPQYTRSKCNTQLWIAALEDLMKRCDIATVIPGHGALSDKKTLSRMKDYFISIRNAIGDREKLTSIKKEFSDFKPFLNFASFDKSVEFMKNEKSDTVKN
jgi:glyoxylase-like metal-dependent hydrolase (beta-lactamase superfamily II)